MVIIALISALVIVAADQFIKLWVLSNLSLHDTIPLIPGVLNLMSVENQGAAFGILQNMQWFFVIVTIAVVGLILYVLFSKKLQSKLFMASSALIMGGAVSNMIDRISRGFVLDYLKLSFFPPVCNLADYCITIGTVLLIVYVLFFSKPLAQKPQPINKNINN